ncbi:DUF6578 domain-containing protein [Streptomyces tibetensis]|uniref:DUF6578 domain-containing protein n=1 Tax=Streptomyces tibetensis TaxID=2382123 RepID=UPI0033C52D07
MGLWHVYYEDWQMECCGTPFSVGDEVSRPLLLMDPDTVLGGGWHDQVTEAAGLVEDVGGVRMVREEPGLPVALGADPDAEEDLRPRPGSRIRSAGLLRVERHGAGLGLPGPVRGHGRWFLVVPPGVAPHTVPQTPAVPPGGARPAPALDPRRAAGRRAPHCPPDTPPCRRSP